MTARIEEYAAAMRARKLQSKKHGNLTKYRNGCRCGFCKAANRRACNRRTATVRLLRVMRGKAIRT